MNYSASSWMTSLVRIGWGNSGTEGFSLGHYRLPKMHVYVVPEFRGRRLSTEVPSLRVPTLFCKTNLRGVCDLQAGEGNPSHSATSRNQTTEMFGDASGLRGVSYRRRGEEIETRFQHHRLPINSITVQGVGGSYKKPKRSSRGEHLATDRSSSHANDKGVVEWHS